MKVISKLLEPNFDISNFAITILCNNLSEFYNNFAIFFIINYIISILCYIFQKLINVTINHIYNILIKPYYS